MLVRIISIIILLFSIISCISEEKIRDKYSASDRINNSQNNSSKLFEELKN